MFIFPVKQLLLYSVVGDRCTDIDCGIGRQCIVTEGGKETCVCAQPEECPPGHKLICGSDGNLYESHCSLHRTACKQGQRISVDRFGAACFEKGMVCLLDISHRDNCVPA